MGVNFLELSLICQSIEGADNMHIFLWGTSDKSHHKSNMTEAATKFQMTKMAACKRLSSAACGSRLPHPYVSPDVSPNMQIARISASAT